MRPVLTVAPACFCCSKACIISCLIRRRGRGKRSASHHVSAESHRSLPFGKENLGVAVAVVAFAAPFSSLAGRDNSDATGLRRLGVDVEFFSPLDPEPPGAYVEGPALLGPAVVKVRRGGLPLLNALCCGLVDGGTDCGTGGIVRVGKACAYGWR